LNQELGAMQMLRDAESGNLRVNLSSFQVGEVLDALQALLEPHVEAEGKSLLIKPDYRHVYLRTDKQLLLRVLTSMASNALEVSRQDQYVVIWFETKSGVNRFSVQNESRIQPEIAKRIFQRTFTTQAGKHGLGTYMMRLLGVTYLKGQVNFTTDETHGTTFWIDLPAAAIP